MISQNFSILLSNIRVEQRVSEQSIEQSISSLEQSISNELSSGSTTPATLSRVLPNTALGQLIDITPEFGTQIIRWNTQKWKGTVQKLTYDVVSCTTWLQTFLFHSTNPPSKQQITWSCWRTAFPHLKDLQPIIISQQDGALPHWGLHVKDALDCEYLNTWRSDRPEN